MKGSPSRVKTIQDIALMANVAWNMPAGMEAGLEATSFYDPPNFVLSLRRARRRGRSRSRDGHGSI